MSKYTDADRRACIHEYGEWRRLIVAELRMDEYTRECPKCEAYQFAHDDTLAGLKADASIPAYNAVLG